MNLILNENTYNYLGEEIKTKRCKHETLYNNNDNHRNDNTYLCINILNKINVLLENEIIPTPEFLEIFLYNIFNSKRINRGGSTYNRRVCYYYAKNRLDDIIYKLLTVINPNPSSIILLFKQECKNAIQIIHNNGYLYDYDTLIQIFIVFFIF